MEILFDIDSENSGELHKILGFVDSDFTMLQVLPYLTKSSREIYYLVGKPNYDKAAEKYEDDDLEDPFLNLLRYTIALGAFRQLAPLLDVSATTQGRVFRADDHLKAAFEWMIDKSDDAMERSYYASIDEILTFIVETQDYDTSPRIQNVKELFVNSLSVFQDFVSINDSHLLFFKLAPSLRLAEEQLIKPRVNAKFVQYKENEDTPVNHLIKNICVYFAMMDGLQKNSVQLFPRGVLKEVPNKTKYASASRVDIESSSLYYRDQLQGLLRDLELQIKKENMIISKKTPLSFTPDDGFISM